MRPELYYHILRIGIVQEKGRKDGDRWKWKEQKLLSDECILWRNLIKYADLEYKGTDCSEKALEDLKHICGMYRLPNYERIISIWPDVAACSNVYELEPIKRDEIVNIMSGLLNDFEKCLSDKNGKNEAYGILIKLHNIPRELYGADVLEK